MAEIAGALTGPLLELLIREGRQATLIVADATRVLAGAQTVARARRSGIDLAVRRRIRIAALTSSPFHPDADLSPEQAFRALVDASAGRWPVYDVVAGLAGMRLDLDSALTEEAFALADSIAAPVMEFALGHTTVAIERTVARLFGVDGVDELGVPLPNVLVDALGPALPGGLALPLAQACIDRNATPQQVAEAVAAGDENWCLAPIFQPRRGSWSCGSRRRPTSGSSPSGPGETRSSRSTATRRRRGSMSSSPPATSTRTPARPRRRRGPAPTSSRSSGRPRRACSTTCPTARRPRASAARSRPRPTSAACGPRSTR